MVLQPLVVTTYARFPRTSLYKSPLAFEESCLQSILVAFSAAFKPHSFHSDNTSPIYHQQCPHSFSYLQKNQLSSKMLSDDAVSFQSKIISAISTSMTTTRPLILQA